jgi:hypothetical protein
MKFLVFVATTAFAGISWAGATNVELTCRSQTGRTQVTASVPGDLAQFDLDFKIDGKVATYRSSKTPGGSIIDVVDDLENKEYTLSISTHDLGEVFKLVAIPRTIKSSGDGNFVKARFAAQILPVTLDPRQDLVTRLKDSIGSGINVTCTYLYEL